MDIYKPDIQLRYTVTSSYAGSDHSLSCSNLKLLETLQVQLCLTMLLGFVKTLKQIKYVTCLVT